MGSGKKGGGSGYRFSSFGCTLAPILSSFFCEWLMLHVGSCKHHMPGGNSVAYIQEYYKGPYPLD